MRKFCSLLLCLTVFLSTAQAQQASDTVKVGFVNIRKLITQAPQVDAIRKTLAKEFEDKNQQIIALRQELAKLNLAYDNERSEEDLSALQTHIGSKQLELSKLQQSLQDAYSLRRNEELGKLQTLIVQMVAEVSKEKALDIVLNNTGVIYINARVDITPAVFARLSEHSASEQ